MRAHILAILAAPIVALPAAANAQEEGAGQAAYERHCIQCHDTDDEAVGTLQLGRTRGEELALLTERSDLTGEYIAAIVRNGLNAMPGFLPSELTAAQLDALVDYLTAASAASRATQAD